MKIKRLVCLLAAILMLAGLVGCGDSEKDSANSIKIWAPSEEQDILSDMCDAFKEQYPEYADITITFTTMGVDSSISTIKKDPDTAADIFLYPSGGIAELTSAGLIFPISIDTEALKETHTEAAIEACTMDGKIYGVPVTPNSWIMYYNKSLFSEDDVKSVEKMLAKDLGAGKKNFSSKISDSWYSSAFFLTAGCKLFGENGDDPTQCDFNNANGFKAGKYMLELSKNPNYLEDTDGNAGNQMAEGKLGALCSGTWSAKTLKAQLGENYGACKLPTIRIDGKDVQMANFSSYKAYGVNSVTKNSELAIKLASWLGSETCQMIRFETNFDAPTVKSLLTHPSVVANLEVSALLDQVQYSVREPITAKLGDFWTPANAFGSEIVNGTLTDANLQEKLDSLVGSITTSLVS